MTPKTARPQVAATLALALFAGLAATAGAIEPVRTTLFGGLAVDGHDVVAYFTDAKPVEGSADFTQAWQGATWRFASAEHRDLFAAAPEKYAPRFGGYCAYAVANGYTAKIDPRAWDIVEGQLYLNYSLDVQKKWRAERERFIRQANEEWPKLLAKKD